VLSKRPAGSLFVGAERDVDDVYAWRLFKGATSALMYSAPRLRFSDGAP